MSITNGTIEYSRRIRTGDFEHKDAKVSLSFTVPDGGDVDALIELVGGAAVLRAHTMVGEQRPAVAPAPKVKTWAGPSVGQRVADPAPPAAPVEQAITGLTPAGTLNGPGAIATASPSEIITDKKLVEELTAKNARLLGHAETDLERSAAPVKLHKLVAEFVPPPAKVQAIPQEKRAEFLQRLAALV